jgi:hypothetical protein
MFEGDLAGKWIESNPFVEAPLAVRVHVSGSDALSGRELSRFQEGGLLVVANLSDGTTIKRAVEIPDGRIEREIRVKLP